jgi:hypothetical protein
MFGSAQPPTLATAIDCQNPKFDEMAAGASGHRGWELSTVMIRK